MNVVAFFHAYKFTHFTDKKVTKTNAKNLSALGKIKSVFLALITQDPKTISRQIKNFRWLNFKATSPSSVGT